MTPDIAWGFVVKTIQSISVAVVRFGAVFAVSLAAAAPVCAADLSFELAEPPASDWSSKFAAPPRTFVGEFALRFWAGQVNTAKNLYDPAGAALLSRLTYGDMSLYAGEAFSRFDFNNGLFVKGYVGGGVLWDGSLKDEDFGLPLPLQPYSATRSKQEDGSVSYVSIDAGFKLLRGPDFSIGVFGGYHFLRQTVVAFGCTQLADNPLICPPGLIPDFVKVISQTNSFNAVRVGVEAMVEFDRRWKLSVDAAWLPYVRLNGADTHALRIGTNFGDFTGPIPEDGNGWGYQVEGFLSYRMNDYWSVALGGRYWHAQSNGFTHFEGHVVGIPALPQPVHWKTESFGVLLQSTIKLGPYPIFSGS
ncbi:MAG: hypothetical protein QOI12_4775 [Alphaproteobacteria bacterium]|jgi:hypothetical protein|nr:hypothetical protein [Alphaproteobacteria bacterium]